MSVLKNILLLAIVFIFPAVSLALELSSSTIEGSWKIIQMGNDKEDGTDKWEFQDGQFIQNLGGHRMAPDRYTIKGNLIDLGYASIKIMEMNGSQMKAKFGQAHYVLEKISDTVTVTPKPKKDIPPGIKESIEGLADAIIKQLDDSAELNCQKAVKNSHQSIDSMLSIGEKNYQDGYLEKENLEKTAANLKSAMQSITLNDCEGSDGKKKAFYKCMSSDRNIFISCAKAYL